MKEIAIWGTGKKCAMWYGWLKRHYKIVCMIDTNCNGDINQYDGVEIIGINRIACFRLNCIVVVTRTKLFEEIIGIAHDAGIPERIIYSLEDFLRNENLIGDYENETIEKQLEVIRTILSASDERINDKKWLLNQICKYGIFCFRNDWKNMKWMNWNELGLQQIPEEFSDYCTFLSQFRIKEAVEIGVFGGGSAYLQCAILLRKNPNLKYTLIDIEDHLNSFERFHNVLPPLERMIPATSKDFQGKCSDLVFIDADHSYDAVIADYESVGKYANKIITFHDIYAHEYDCENGGTVRAWNEIIQKNNNKKVIVFSKYPDQWMGIGCVYS